jgi:hypothetical protein
MDMAQAFLGEIVAILGYALVGTAVYKLFQIATELSEIKALLQKSARNTSLGPESSSTVSAADGDDAAADYAANLLRSLQAESARSDSETQKTR